MVTFICKVLSVCLYFVIFLDKIEAIVEVIFVSLFTKKISSWYASIFVAFCGKAEVHRKVIFTMYVVEKITPRFVCKSCVFVYEPCPIFSCPLVHENPIRVSLLKKIVTVAYLGGSSPLFVKLIQRFHIYVKNV